MNTLRVCLVQSDLTWESKSANTNRLQGMIETIPSDTHIIVLPEMFSTGFSMNPKPLAESMNGPTIQWMRDMARMTGALIVGSLIIEDNSFYYNRFLAVSGEGIHAFYDKRHLFRMSNEESHYKAGSRRVVFEWKGWRILPQVCYDLRFPVWIRNRDDYDLAIFVANWPDPRRSVWLNLLTARALENQAYVVGTNRVGYDNKQILHSGDSVVIDPKGNFIANAGSKESILSADLSLTELKKFRDKFPAHLDSDSFTINY